MVVFEVHRQDGSLAKLHNLMEMNTFLNAE